MQTALMVLQAWAQHARAGPTLSRQLRRLSSLQAGPSSSTHPQGSSAPVGLQDPEQPSTSGRGDGASPRAPGKRAAVDTTAPWPWIDPTRPYIMPKLVSSQRSPMRLAEAILQMQENAAQRNSLATPQHTLSGRPRPLVAFDETVELILRLAADPRKADQVVRGIALLPHGTGKRLRVAVFAKDAEAEEARAAGADIVGEEPLIAEIIEKGAAAVQFDRLVATPSFMKALARAGKVLGPMGLMPNPKMGTLTTDVGRAVRELRAGRSEFRAARDGQLMAAVGKASFPAAKLAENVAAFVAAVVDARPKGLPGQGTQGLITAVHIKSSMTAALPVVPESCLVAPPAGGQDSALPEPGSAAQTDIGPS